MKNKKKTIIISIALIALASFFVGRRFMKSESGTSFQLAEVVRGNLEDIISSTGELKAVTTVNVGSQVSGTIEKLAVDFNDQVKEGDLLISLDKSLFKASVLDAEGGLIRARAEHQKAKIDLDRNQPLFKKGYLSESEFLVLQTAVDTARAAVKSAEASLKRAKTNLGYADIRSPIDGTIIKRSVDAGQTIAASFQTPELFIIAEDLTKMQIEADVDESDIGQIKEDLSVRFTVQAHPEKTFTGKVRQIRLQPETIQNVVNYTVIVNAPNPERLLLPGMTATVDFMVKEVKDVLLVSNKALSFTPPMEMMREMFQKMREGGMGQSSPMGMPGAGGFPSMGGGRNMPDDVGRIFYLDAEGNLKIGMIQKGATDGMVTEIKKIIRGSLTAGTRVITGTTKNKTAKSESKNTLLPRPPRGPR